MAGGWLRVLEHAIFVRVQPIEAASVKGLSPRFVVCTYSVSRILSGAGKSIRLVRKRGFGYFGSLLVNQSETRHVVPGL